MMLIAMIRHEFSIRNKIIKSLCPNIFFRTGPYLLDINGKLLKNIPQGNKKPLSSMSPLIIFDKNDNFYMTVGSPGGKAIISYVFRVISEDFFSDYKIREIIERPNFIKINGKNFFEKKILNDLSSENGKIRNLTSGLAVIKKKNGHYIGVADSRRDGSVRGK